MAKFGRNSPCHCGSGKKFKKCCLGKPPEPDPDEPKDGREAVLERGRQALRRSGLLPGSILSAMNVMDVRAQRRLEDHRHETFLRAEFKKLGRSDEEIDRMFPKGR